ncbi:hypothetical protein KKA85_04240 [bacterium]|nr:hypothetical protein [bacterium]MBU1674971.1 hypothetical protein [bacterium]
MRIETWMSVFSRMMFIVAMLFFFLAVFEKIANLNGQTLSFINYEPGRLLEFSAIMLLFVITVTLRRIRKETGKRRD